GEAVIHPRLAMVQDATILGMAVMNASLEERIKIFSSLAEGLKTNKLNPVIGKSFSLPDAALAHEAILAPGAYGKIVLIP
ncbi:MAG: zinc-binding dehydrogenase, partial [Candidatus Omnitrophica bacterium]|nr:zinc-binding dehydrogenase [Candidatus Omnitrophota bacterium]